MIARRRLTVLAVCVPFAGVAVAGCAQSDPLDTNAQAKSGSYGTCADYPTQKAAQKAWKKAGKPKRADGDGDGKVCESLPATKPSGPSTSTGTSDSTRQSGTAQTTDCKRPNGVVNISFSSTKYPNIMRHTEQAIAKGWPSVLIVNRVGAEERRAKLLADIPTKPGYDRDEYPAAFARGNGPGLQRGSDPTGWKADVMYVPSSENRSHGSVMGIKLRPYCDGTKFRYVFY